MARLFLILVLVIGLMWIVSKIGSSASQVNRQKYFKLALLYGAVGILLVLILTAKLPAFFALILAAVPWIQRIIMLRSAYNMFKSWQGGPVPGSKPGQTSDVKTKFLEMTLDHDSGEIQGEVIYGNFKGQRLDELSIDQLAELLVECQRKDQQSYSLLETYLSRMRPDEWQEYVKEHAGEHAPPPGADEMTREEALEILGLDESASKQDIIEAHRILMQRNHPDRGGSTWVAARINRAKDVLLA
ncbi:MAG: molecular chaperone DnaJ [Gammaproteobacteria bacterium]|nr:molecular chaperone DnaJ [Gammaproteobacteria bacterium]